MCKLCLKLVEFALVVGTNRRADDLRTVMEGGGTGLMRHTSLRQVIANIVDSRGVKVVEQSGETRRPASLTAEGCRGRNALIVHAN